MNRNDMLIVDGKIIEPAVLQSYFACNLNACKGACCWEGEYGAPLDESELHVLEHIYPSIEPYLDPDGIAVIKEKGLFEYFKGMKAYGTPLLKNGACAFLTYTKEGTALCGIESAWRDQAVDFRKPISCHLYPIRVEHDRKTNFTILRYDEWDICQAACAKGAKDKIPLYQFAKEALIRAYGESFYAELEAMARYINK